MVYVPTYFGVFFKCCFLSWGQLVFSALGTHFFVIVGLLFSAVSWLERVISKMTSYMSNGILNSTSLLILSDMDFAIITAWVNTT